MAVIVTAAVAAAVVVEIVVIRQADRKVEAEVKVAQVLLAVLNSPLHQKIAK